MTRVLLIAPSMEITGGQSVQAKLLLELLLDAGLEMRFQANNPAFPPGLKFVKRIPFVRTALNAVIYGSQLLARAWRVDILHIFTAGLSSYTMWTIPAILAGRLF